MLRSYTYLDTTFDTDRKNVFRQHVGLECTQLHDIKNLCVSLKQSNLNIGIVGGSRKNTVHQTFVYKTRGTRKYTSFY